MRSTELYYVVFRVDGLSSNGGTPINVSEQHFANEQHSELRMEGAIDKYLALSNS